jgi:hypothetical protein
MRMHEVAMIEASLSVLSKPLLVLIAGPYLCLPDRLPIYTNVNEPPHARQ